MGFPCAVVTAGGLAAPEFAALLGTNVKALAPLGAGRLIDPVIEAVRGIRGMALAVVGPLAVRDYCEHRTDRFIEAAAAGGENIVRALRAFPDASQIVFLTSDLPFVDAAGLREFIDASAGHGLTMALSSQQSYCDRFPGAPPHAVRLGAASYANGSAFVIERGAVAAVERVAERVFAARKSLPRLAALLGVPLSVRFALRTLRIADIERRTSDLLGVSARAIVTADPGLCFDIDDATDWRYAQRMVAVYG